MPKYLSKAEIYRLLQRELPEDVYADGPASAFYTTADHGGAASAMATTYANLERIYENYFPLTADEKIGDHEITVFGQLSQDPMTLAERRDAIVAKLRDQPTMNKFDMLTRIEALLPADTVVEIFEWCNMPDENWTLDVSELGVDTYLGTIDRFLAEEPGFDYCSDEVPTEAREIAFTYEVRIFEYTLSDQERQDIEDLLNLREPARSRHFIVDGLPLDTALTTEDGDTIITEDEVEILIDE